MRKGYKITLGVLTVMILITITIGTSYSYYSVSDIQDNPNTLASTCFNIEYTEGTNGSISLTNSYPMSEANALALTPYNFTITNTCAAGNQTVNYVVTLNTLTAKPSTLTSSLNYKLNKTAPTAIVGTTGTLSTPYALNPNVKTDEGIDTSYSLEVGTLAPGESKTFNLYLWINENANNTIMGQTFEGKVLVYSYI
ncbi:MAG: hypothetical protein HFI49_04075 [Bacilli bacterium]|jgi:hypothetical protein|nr:hypothetical protein [Bacilli bacterium]